MCLAGAVLLGLGDLVALAGLTLMDANKPPAANQAFYDRQPWGAEYQREAEGLGDHYVPYVGWKVNPLEGRLLRIGPDGERRVPGARCEAGAFTVFAFGGSAMWGEGVPDEFTVPARLQALLAARMTRPVCVRNLAQPGWVSTQGVIELIRHLQQGEKPDVVIFLDGLNDVAVLGDDGVAGRTFGDALYSERFGDHGFRQAAVELVKATHLYQLSYRLRERRWQREARERLDDDVAPVSAEAVMRPYLSNLDTVGGLAQQYGFQAAFFWQPMLWLKEGPLTAEETAVLAEAAARRGLRWLLRQTFEIAGAETARRPTLRTLQDALAGATALAYLDDVHFTPAGAEIAARRMAEAVPQADLPTPEP